jgi:hypothetical protein
MLAPPSRYPSAWLRGRDSGRHRPETAIRTLRNPAVPEELVARAANFARINNQAYEVPAERRPCPTLESVAAK